MVMQFLSGGYLARWSLRNQEGFFFSNSLCIRHNRQHGIEKNFSNTPIILECWLYFWKEHAYILLTPFSVMMTSWCCVTSANAFISIEVTKFFLRRPKALDQSEGTFVGPTSSSHINDMRSFPFTCLSNSIHWVWSWLICFKSVNSRGAKGEQN